MFLLVLSCFVIEMDYCFVNVFVELFVVLFLMLLILLVLVCVFGVGEVIGLLVLYFVL